MSADIEYVRGDATLPCGPGPKIIAHVCNDIGAWGAGFVVAVSRRWPQPEAAYRQWHRDRATSGFALGAAQFVQVDEQLWVANMVGQHGIRTRTSRGTPVRYEAMAKALAVVGEKAVAEGATVHMPRIGCGLAGGRWETVEPLIAGHLTRRGIAVTVYDPL